MSSRARRELRKQARHRKISSPSRTPRFSGKWPPCKGSPASLVWTPISSAARSAFRRNFSIRVRTLRAPAAAASSRRSAPASAPRSARSPAHFSSELSLCGRRPRRATLLLVRLQHLRMILMPASWFAILAAIVSGTVQFVLFLRWLHRRMRKDEIAHAFIHDIATNHLPHIYNALQKIATQQGIELDDTPLVRFVDLNGHRRTLGDQYP